MWVHIVELCVVGIGMRVERRSNESASVEGYKRQTEANQMVDTR